MRKRKFFSLIERVILVAVMVSHVSRAITAQAQEFKLFDHEVQVHGWLSQGFVYTDQNNWLTMSTTSGSGAMTDMGLNMSAQVTDKFRVGAQVYDRNLGQLGQWHPLLDWAVADYRFTQWFGIRGGKVKTMLGLYNDSQDQEFIHPFALLPQSVYPADLRDSAIAHTGGDVYGIIPLGRRLGDLSYTAYAGHREDSHYGGYTYLAAQSGLLISRFGGLQYGADLRWNTPLKGLLVGVSRLNEDITGRATWLGSPLSTIPPGRYREWSNSAWTNQYYGQYVFQRLQVDAEYRRNWLDESVFNGFERVHTDVRGWYVSGAFRIMKRLQVGSYYSRYRLGSPELAFFGFPPSGHIYDKVVTAGVELNRFLNIKLEGHFMDIYGISEFYPSGFYLPQNPQGLKPTTNALVIRTSFHF
jgi:hypothetical protein